MKVSNEFVLQFLPHRDPFLFIDSVKDVIPARELTEGEILPLKELVGSKVQANFHMREDHPIFAGHFPGNPIFPGVAQVEMMAQASSFIYVNAFENPYGQNMDVALVSISNAKFRKPVLPGMDLEIETECTKIRGPMVESHCKLFCDGQLMSECTVMASVKM
ncbi:beta-hydroxyacyl-ACP dehydratase [Halobacteriovorax marinus]|uniref:(3R)-hydroxymyristol-[acyl carrier protein] dehydratase n=1 Tax=Halobacteriovorax marinus (strain ATCC BAA-682 / DSM 15412 / SJ) TaxID=862908 RepID=E1X518_HALMS|nr:3-hydroxyacyl-ACP dehydratase FabZ family protein [Halobacteriovorax marinus]ATH06917.1 beta-hydroxyacyl-ACP dehydratase [Halobacteriovorax marinus]CBW25489.1 (3R)-hydroxymyristol-[acyl carrier protein] dehydratase [Halobacteriovorax marinus SJ]